MNELYAPSKGTFLGEQVNFASIVIDFVSKAVRRKGQHDGADNGAYPAGHAARGTGNGLFLIKTLGGSASKPQHRLGSHVEQQVNTTEVGDEAQPAGKDLVVGARLKAAE